MTRTLYLLIILLPALRVQAQRSAVPLQAAADPRLYEVFDSAYLSRLATENPTLLQRWNYYLDNAFVISDFPEKKGDMSRYPAVQIPDTAHLNILALEKRQHLARNWDAPVFYRIEGTDQVLMYFSGKEFNRKFRRWLSR